MVETLEAVVARIDEGVKNLNGKVEALATVTEKRLGDHAGRVRSLELFRSRLKGGGAAVSFLLAFTGAIGLYFRLR
jgi:hypothetical protein